MNSHPSLAFLAILGIALLSSLMLQMQPVPSLLYIQDAESGTFVASEDGDSTHFTLTLNGITPLATYYSDRLDRITGRIRTANFIRIEGLFEEQDPPMAVVILSDDSNLEMNAVAVELYHPQYNSIEQQITYEVAVLSEALSPGLANWRADIDAALPEAFERVRLIIDRASFQLNHILWTFEFVDASGEPMPNLALTLEYTTLSGEEVQQIRVTNDMGQVTFSIRSTFSLAAMLTYASAIDDESELMFYAIPITARCSGTFNLVYGDEPAEGAPLTLPCPVES